MESIYDDTAKILKALSDPKRLRIVDMLSCGELCACKILEEFQITQPTLSHDMKVLIATKIVKDRREGKNTYYSLDREKLSSFQETLSRMVQEKPNCICHKKPKRLLQK
ncbi:MAG: metalloregulator ArsR/SmtB family transcription factor [Sphaerochaetaceae bacterium]|jgi:ArsR family transcriptional regulator